MKGKKEERGEGGKTGEEGKGKKRLGETVKVCACASGINFWNLFHMIVIFLYHVILTARNTIGVLNVIALCVYHYFIMYAAC